MCVRVEAQRQVGVEDVSCTQAQTVLPEPSSRRGIEHVVVIRRPTIAVDTEDRLP